MRHATILVAILAFVPLTSATAQVPVRPGARVRVTHLPRHSVGTFLAWKSDTLVFQSNRDTLSVPVDLMARLEVSRGEKTIPGRGAVIGLLLGGVAGAVIGHASRDPQCEPWCIYYDVAGVMFGGLGGAVAGALIGSLIKTDRWVEVSLDWLRVSMTPRRDGRFGFGASVRF